MSDDGITHCWPKCPTCQKRHAPLQPCPAPSPLPWHVDYSNAPEIRYGMGLADEFICRSQTGYHPTDLANVLLICKAVNSYAAHFALIEELQTALEEMGCSELPDCEQPQTRGSKHAKNCDWAIAIKALIKARAALEGR